MFRVWVAIHLVARKGEIELGIWRGNREAGSRKGSRGKFVEGFDGIADVRSVEETVMEAGKKG